MSIILLLTTKTLEKLFSIHLLCSLPLACPWEKVGVQNNLNRFPFSWKRQLENFRGFFFGKNSTNEFLIFKVYN